MTTKTTLGTTEPRSARAVARIAGLVVLAAALAMSTGACSEPSPSDASVTPEAALERLSAANPPLYLDVRTPAEYERAHIPGSLNIPHTEVAERIGEIRAEGKDEIIIYCERGGRAREATEALEAAGVGDVVHMTGDMRVWRKQGYPTVTGSERGEPGA